jgi:hypothetical protein
VTQRYAGDAREIEAVEQDLARRRLDEAIDAADQRALAGAGWPDDRRDAFRGDCDVDVVQHRLTWDISL